jgi:hypothetical protein
MNNRYIIEGAATMNEEEIEEIEENARIEEDKYKDMVHRERKYKGYFIWILLAFILLVTLIYIFSIGSYYFPF